MIEITWKRKTEPYTNGISCYLGKVRVGSVDWDSINTDLKYKVTCLLPSITQKTTNYLTQELAKEKLETMINFWISSAGL